MTENMSTCVNIGLGPGSAGQLTPEAAEALRAAALCHPDTEEGVAQDQLRPCISHDRECATDRVTQNRVFQTLIHDFGSSVGDEFHDHQVEVSFEEADPRFCPAQVIR